MININNSDQNRPVALSAKNVGKHFKIYKDKPMTLKDRMLSFVKKSYDEFWAIKDVTLDIYKGEAVGLIGHNGCGKSTLLKLFTRIIYPEKGEIIVNGKVSSLLELGAGFHPDFTGRENIYTNASIFGLKKSEIDKISEDIIRFSELGEFIDNPVRTYSSGMYMRLAFSVAIHVNPEILLIDEILAVGDSNFQKKCLDKITEFKKNGVTIVIVSHDLGTIERICDKAVWLDGGVIREQGKPKKVVNAYLAQMAENQNDKVFREIDIVGSDDDITLETDIKEEIPEEKTRWGNKNIEITSVRLLDKNGAERSVFDVEAAMDIEISFKLNKPVDEVGFGIGIFGTDGIQRYGTKTFIDDFPLDIDKNGKIIFSIERLGLIEGSYWLDAAAHDRMGTPYDYILKSAEFYTASNIKDVGMTRFPHEWKIQF